VTIETDCTDSPVCPHCGTVYEDAWEWNFDGAEQRKEDCDHCGKSFLCERDISVTYSTRPAETVDTSHE